jgi:hypothetical protein
MDAGGVKILHHGNHFANGVGEGVHRTPINIPPLNGIPQIQNNVNGAMVSRPGSFAGGIGRVPNGSNGIFQGSSSRPGSFSGGIGRLPVQSSPAPVSVHTNTNDVSGKSFDVPILDSVRSQVSEMPHREQIIANRSPQVSPKSPSVIMEGEPVKMNLITVRPTSPIDTTPITINGEIIKESDIPDISNPSKQILSSIELPPRIGSNDRNSLISPPLRSPVSLKSPVYRSGMIKSPVSGADIINKMNLLQSPVQPRSPIQSGSPKLTTVGVSGVNRSYLGPLGSPGPLGSSFASEKLKSPGPLGVSLSSEMLKSPAAGYFTVSPETFLTSSLRSPITGNDVMKKIRTLTSPKEQHSVITSPKEQHGVRISSPFPNELSMIPTPPSSARPEHKSPKTFSPKIAQVVKQSSPELPKVSLLVSPQQMNALLENSSQGKHFVSYNSRLNSPGTSSYIINVKEPPTKRRISTIRDLDMLLNDGCVGDNILEQSGIDTSVFVETHSDAGVGLLRTQQNQNEQDFLNIEDMSTERREINEYEPRVDRVFSKKSKRDKYPDFNTMELTKQFEYLTKFRFVFSECTKYMPGYKLPPNISDLPLIQQFIEAREISSKIAVIKSTNKLKFYIMIVIAGVQMGCGFFGIDVEGYFTSQMNVMDYYGELLDELGEIEVGFGSGYPVWVRLTGFGMLQLAIIIFINFVAKKCNISGEIKNEMKTAISSAFGSGASFDDVVAKGIKSLTGGDSGTGIIGSIGNLMNMFGGGGSSVPDPSDNQ